MRLPNDIIVHYEERADGTGIEGHYAGELIRCKDCKFRYTDGDNVTANYCLLNHNRVMADDWFCADAEREEE